MNDLPRRDDEHLTLTTPDEAQAGEGGIVHSADGLPRDAHGHVIGVWHVVTMSLALGDEPDARVWAARHALTGPLAERACALGFGLCAGVGDPSGEIVAEGLPGATVTFDFSDNA